MNVIQSILSQFTKMQLTDYLDIALVAFLIYKLLPLIRTPSTKRIAGTVAGILIVVWVADIANLYTISWILSQFLSVGLLAVVVLFQPELRRMLDRLGGVLRLRTLLGTNKPVQEMDTIITQTVMACETMSREKIGALIVFAREARLEEYFNTGTRIDGQVSEQLIRNIFFPKAALHDGAMIVRDGKISAAGCVLPLSESNRLSADLGTRHRAGVGMSEVSDAVVVIVSEETGTISVAVGGMLKRHLAPETLERLLRNELVSAQSEQENNALVRLIDKMLSTGKEERKDEK
ncbi:MAG: diadenylate cyclase CdaA [Oscillospiraceae bacterium]|nr:diadenylate cyclase CdaA [Oscillospiraceae bacterium]